MKKKSTTKQQEVTENKQGISTTGEIYRPLEKEFTRHGYLMKEIKREGLVAMYEQLDLENNNQRVCFEVFEIIQMDAGFAGPQKYPQPAREVAPGNEMWGTKGFSPATRELAELRFSQIKARIALREVTEKKSGASTSDATKKRSK